MNFHESVYPANGLRPDPNKILDRKVRASSVIVDQAMERVEKHLLKLNLIDEANV